MVVHLDKEAYSSWLPVCSTGGDAGDSMADKGYVGSGMITPIRKPAHRELLDWEKDFNTQVNKIHRVIVCIRTLTEG